jgi:hypothetical protein
LRAAFTVIPSPLLPLLLLRHAAAEAACHAARASTC